MTETWAVVLAAGEGTRMRSRRAKVLHPLGGRPLVSYPVALARAVGVAGCVVVVGHQARQVREALGEAPDLRFVDQVEQRGTGHALLVAQDAVSPKATEVLLLCGDVPLLRVATAERLLDHHRRTRAAATVLTVEHPDPTGYGRILRRAGRVVGIVEERDASAAQRRVREINSGIYCFDPRRLWPALSRVTARNAQGEYYLTDVVGRLVRSRQRVEGLRAGDPGEVAGVNDRAQLAALEDALRKRTLARLMAEGVGVVDPASTCVAPDVAVGRDTLLYPGVVLEAGTVIGEGCIIGPGCQLTDVTLGDDVTLRAYCVLAESVVDSGAVLGPFAHLRPGSVVGPGARVGNFVELKKSVIGRRAKVPHLSYVGDATVGEEANVGAGAITCNYDGARKHETRIGARAFVGTNASLVAPLTVGDGAYVGAGSVITKDVPAGALAVGRAHQVTKEGWAERRRARAARAAGTPGA